MPYRVLSALLRSNSVLPTHNVIYGGHRNCSSTTNNDGASDANAQPVAIPPIKRLAILTCMDARINPFKQLGLQEGDAHIIRNAGGMARDAIRSLIISQRLLGTREIAVYHHTGCGMVTFKSPGLRQLVKDSDPEAFAHQENAKLIDEINFLEFDDLEESVKSDVKFLKESPLLMKGTKVTGWIHYVETGKATRIV
ncbi:carbonic anhydrase [Dendrothele bispora CBS 962.96]|uniref:Carbonic anhydrase n=1 Tax=Dendrothele bispora (strain CBS 962.96) TaxID=1314807 RepID=A0A4V4HIN0_DENBC|nr:carbonic anhydrase [Dendrothele bispora CBS 962.96]